MKAPLAVRFAVTRSHWRSSLVCTLDSSLFPVPRYYVRGTNRSQFSLGAQKSIFVVRLPWDGRPTIRFSSLQPSGALEVALRSCGRVVLAAVNLDHKFVLETDDLDDVGADGGFLSKLGSAELAGAEFPLEALLGLKWTHAAACGHA